MNFITQVGYGSKQGLATEFRSEKIPRNRLRTVSVISQKKVLIPRRSEFYGRVNSEYQCFRISSVYIRCYLL
jgi:hypothetical protein